MASSWIQFLADHEMRKSESITEVSYECSSNKQHAVCFISEWIVHFGLPHIVRFVADRAPDSRSISLPASQAVVGDSVDHFLDNELFRLAIIIDKKVFAPQMGFDCNLRVFSDMSAVLECIADCSLESVESVLFPSDKPTVIFLFNDSVPLVTNGAISICNESTVSGINQEVVLKAFDNIQQKRRLRNENVRWNEHCSLTPDHLIFYDFTDNQIPLIAFLHTWAVKLCVIFIASYTFRLDDGNFTSVFTGFKEVRFESRIVKDTLDFNVTPLFHIYNWVYSEKTPDKLGLLQQTVSIQFRSSRNSELNTLLFEIDDVFRLVQNGFKKYTEKSIKDYLQERKQIEDFVKATGTDINRQLSQVTDLMTKNLTGILTAALGTTLAYYSSTLKHIVPVALYSTSAFIVLLTVYLSAYSGFNVRNITKDYEARISLFRQTFIEEPVASSTVIGVTTPPQQRRSQSSNNVRGKTVLQIAEEGVSGRLRVFWWFFGITLALNLVLATGAFFLGKHFQQSLTPTATVTAHPMSSFMHYPSDNNKTAKNFDRN